VVRAVKSLRYFAKEVNLDHLFAKQLGCKRPNTFTVQQPQPSSKKATATLLTSREAQGLKLKMTPCNNKPRRHYTKFYITSTAKSQRNHKQISRDRPCQ
jgi:hypothetical protein